MSLTGNAIIACVIKSILDGLYESWNRVEWKRSSSIFLPCSSEVFLLSLNVDSISVKPFSSILCVFCRCGSFNNRKVDIEGSHPVRKIEEEDAFYTNRT